MSPTVLIIDDEEKLRTLLSRLLGLEGYEVFQEGDCRSGMKRLAQSNVDVVICDVRLPDGNGVELTKEIRNKYPLTEVLLLTAYGNIPDGIQAIRNGAFDYITKGDDNNKIVPLLGRAVEKARLNRRVQALESSLESKYTFDMLEGKSPRMQQVVREAKKVADSDASVLLSGETGTGKELFARAIHAASPRHGFPFLAVNCAAFHAELLEDTLFGHKEGAFTGATRNARGIFEEASGGSVFLDEIGDMPEKLQAHLLRVLESGEYFRLGESTPKRSDVRILTATNCDLEKKTEDGSFREDLYYRISVVRINLPPLRERREDIEGLAAYFLSLYASKTNKNLLSFSPAYLEALKRHPWKGNIRELKNCIERSVILSESSELDIQDLPAEFLLDTNETPASRFDLGMLERNAIIRALAETKGNKSEAARLLNIGISTLYRKMEEYSIR